MAGYTFCRWFAAVCLFSIMGLMTSFYIVEKSCTPLYHLARSETPRIPVSGKLSSRRPIATAKSAVMTTLPTGVGANQTREVTLQCKTVCSKSGNGICVPLDLAVFVYKDGIPTKNMTFTLQSHYPVVSIPRNTDISNDSSVLKVDRCNLEEHFPGVELIPRQGSCAVVGNSGILNNSSCGDFIDSHDFVIRANMGLIKGYEVDVGRTSDLNAFNRATLLKYGHAIRAAKKSVERDRFLEHVRTLKESILWYPKSLTKPGGIHRSSVNYRSVINETRKNGLSGIRFAFNWKPIRVEKAWGLRRIATLGLDMYAVARTFCANITLFGFYPFYKDLEGRDIKYHYFDDVKFNYSLNKAHSWDLEHRKLKELERQGKLTLIVRDCKPRKQIPV